MSAHLLERTFDVLIGRPIAYGKEDVRQRNGKLWLEISLGGRRFLLPGVNAGTADSPLMISWFDPNPLVNPQLSEAAAVSMTALFKKLKPRIIVTPPSSKSGPFITEAARRYDSSMRVTTLLGGDNRELVQMESIEPVVDYLPVTRLASRIPKYLGVSARMRVDILRSGQNGFGMVIAEDVRTTGNTIAAMMNVMKVEHSQIAVIANESELTKGYPPRLSPNIRTVMHLPEIAEVDARMLYSIEPKSAIPPAIILK